jgi:hypothetical protein
VAARRTYQTHHTSCTAALTAHMQVDAPLQPHSRYMRFLSAAERQPVGGGQLWAVQAGREQGARCFSCSVILLFAASDPHSNTLAAQRSLACPLQLPDASRLKGDEALKAASFHYVGGERPAEACELVRCNCGSSR